MDRFLMRLHLGYPPPAAEKEILSGIDRRHLLAKMKAIMTRDELRNQQQRVQEIRTSPTLVDYVLRIIQHSRNHKEFQDGLSPRGGMALIRAAKGWAHIHNRDHVLPDDVQAVLPSVVEHRLGGSSKYEHYPLSTRLMREVPVVQ